MSNISDCTQIIIMLTIETLKDLPKCNLVKLVEGQLKKVLYLLCFCYKLFLVALKRRLWLLASVRDSVTRNDLKTLSFSFVW